LSPIALAVTLSAAVTGCSGDDAYRYALDSTIQVRLTEYRLSPQRLIVNAGEIRLFAQNDGRLTHNLVVEEEDAEIGEEPELYGRTPTLHPGELGTEVRPFRLRPGTYRLICSIGNHENLGMHGVLEVIPEGQDPRSR
jgi:uncharacterized cupredoxin-like copper-binding protein